LRPFSSANEFISGRVINPIRSNWNEVKNAFTGAPFSTPFRIVMS